MSADQGGSGPNPDKFNLARKLLSGIGGSAPKPPAEPRKAEREREEVGEPDLLGKLVNAMKAVAPEGPTGVEPEGYGYLAAVRHGDPIGDWSKWEAIEALQGVLARLGYPSAAVSGRWDSTTVSALKKLQREKGCPVTGVFDAATLAQVDKALGLEPGAADAPATARRADSASDFPESGNPFIDGLARGAVKGMLETGVPASVSIAMAVLESGWGERPMARQYHNIFSVKGKGPAGSVTMTDDDDDPQPAAQGVSYRIYNDDAEAVADHARLFATSEQYRGVMTHRGRADNFARALSGIYSPNPNYGNTLLRIMKQFDLYRFDAIRQL